MKKLLLIVVAAAMLFGCSDEGGAKRILTASGFRDIQITGYEFFACGKDDTYSTGFTATGPTGIRVSGTVCSGLFFKNSTIRFD